MTEELSGRRIVVPETRELGQLVRMLEERGAEAIPCDSPSGPAAKKRVFAGPLTLLTLPLPKAIAQRPSITIRFMSCPL